MNTLVLCGFIRRFHDIKTFAIPVYDDGNGRAYAALDNDDDGIVDGFSSVGRHIPRETLLLPIALRIGDPMLYAFETSEHTLSLGSGRPLADLLNRYASKPEYANSAKHTYGLIRRFCEFANTLGTRTEQELLFTLCRAEENSPYTLLSAAPAHAIADEKALVAPGAWKRIVRNLLFGHHDRQLLAHEYAVDRVRSLIAGSADRRSAIEHLLAALEPLAETSGGAAAEGVSPSGGACDYCLDKLLQEHSRPSDRYDEEVLNALGLRADQGRKADVAVEPIVPTTEDPPLVIEISQEMAARLMNFRKAREEMASKGDGISQEKVVELLVSYRQSADAVRELDEKLVAYVINRQTYPALEGA